MRRERDVRDHALGQAEACTTSGRRLALELRDAYVSEAQSSGLADSPPDSKPEKA